MMFTDVRKRLLSSLIREQFRTARSALDRKSFSAAEPPLTAARLMIIEAEKLGVKDDGLGDLSLLVDGFLQLIRSASEQRASPQPVAVAASVGAAVPAIDAAPRPMPAPAAAIAPAPAAAIAPVPAAAPAAVSRPATVSPAPASDAPSASASPRAAANSARIYSVDDEGVSPPVTLDQRMPAMTTEMQVITKSLHTSAVIDVVIDETGRVVDATVRQSLNPSFDTLMVRTARRWKYRPAMKDGAAVPYVKTLVLVP
jgi:TonB family protein